MRKILTTVALLLVLSCPTLAGIMHTPGAPVPPNVEASQAKGEMETPLLVRIALKLIALL